MKKRVSSIIIIISVLFISLTAVLVLALITAPNPGHTSDEVYIRINNVDKTIQQAINDGNFSTCVAGSGTYIGPINFGHKAEEIIVNVNGTIMNLQQAINSGDLTNKSEAGKSPAVFGTIIHGQTGDEINIINKTGTNKTLQKAINDGDFKCDTSTPTIPPATTKECRYKRSTSRYYDPDQYYVNCYLFCVENPNPPCMGEFAGDSFIVRWDSSTIVEAWDYDNANLQKICVNNGYYTRNGYKYSKGVKKENHVGFSSGDITGYYEVCRERV